MEGTKEKNMTILSARKTTENKKHRAVNYSQKQKNNKNSSPRNIPVQ